MCAMAVRPDVAARGEVGAHGNVWLNVDVAVGAADTELPGGN